MSNTCKLCRHPDREVIERELIEGVPLRDIAGRHSISKTALARYKEAHLPEALSHAAGAREEARRLGVDWR